MAKVIIYKGLEFKPVGNILGGWSTKANLCTNRYFLQPEGYSHKDFYNVAKKAHCSVDVYECGGQLYIPTNTRLSGLSPDVRKHIKSITEYTNWYKEYNK